MTSLANPACSPFIVTGRAIARLPGVAELLGATVVHAAGFKDVAAAQGVLAWGYKPSARRAERYAARHALPLLRIEDGFLRSVGLGDSDPPLSLVVDDVGIYYDAASPSRLESLVQVNLSPAETGRATALAGAWRAGRVSKYNHAPEMPLDLPGRFVLVVDQTFGDASIRHGGASAASFGRMLEAALDEHPGATVLLKIHPDVFAGHKRGHFERLTAGQAARVRVLGEDVHPVGLLERAEAVYVVTSQMGFEAVLWGRPVRCFGMPFYAGWGLTGDELSRPPRRASVSRAQLIHAALITYPRYLDPESGQRCEVERVLEHLALQRQMRSRFPARIEARGFSWWKRPIARAFLQGSTVEFSRGQRRRQASSALAVWGRSEAAEGCDGAVLRLEDGFLRSVGLGADLVRPLSWVVDRQGIYFDSTRPSELECLMQTAEFDEALRARARRLRERIIAEGLTKYNVGEGRWSRPSSAEKVILVPGQVERDASIRYGAPGISTNLGVVRAVRAANPDAWIVYKPHPDVLAGLRAKGRGEDEAASRCDEIVTDVAMGNMLPLVDEVHLLTSLAGFEALLRGKAVTCYGQPFYSGWGLTTDMMPVRRRTRRLTLDELVAAVLILYPLYVSRATGRYTTPERALDELLLWRDQNGAALPSGGAVLRLLLRWWAWARRA